MDTSHLHALETRRDHETARLRAEKTPSMKTLRGRWVARIEKEIADERKFLGMPPEDDSIPSGEELLAALRS